MSEYRVDGRVPSGAWRVLDTKHSRVIGYGSDHYDAERIARALSVLDAMEQGNGKVVGGDMSYRSIDVKMDEPWPHPVQIGARAYLVFDPPMEKPRKRGEK